MDSTYLLIGVAALNAVLLAILVWKILRIATAANGLVEQTNELVKQTNGVVEQLRIGAYREGVTEGHRQHETEK